MGGWSDTLENQILDHFTGNGTWTPPATIYVALFIGDPDGAGSEVVAGDYARVAGSFGAASGGSCSNDGLIDFGEAASDWGEVTHFALYDAATLGNMQASGTLDATANITSGEDVSFPVGSLILTQN